MQQANKNITKFKIASGIIFKKIREDSVKTSRSNFAREYDIDRGNLSKIENGKLSCSLITSWRICEAVGIKFSDFAKLLEEELGDDFKLIDE